MKVYKPAAPPRHTALWSAAALVVGAVALAGLTYVLATPTGDPEAIWKAAEEDFLAGRYDRVDQAVARLAKLRDPTPLDHFLKAQVAMARRRGTEALTELALVPDTHYMAGQARLLAGQHLLREKHLTAAEALLKEAVRLDPSLVQAHRELIYIYGMLLRRPELNAEFRALSERTALTFDNAFHWCLTRNNVWEPKEITADLRGFVEADPADKWSRLALAENLRQVGAREESEKVLDALPRTDDDAKIIRARIAFDRNDEEAADRILANASLENPELARLRGRLALARRDGPAALEAFRAAHAKEPDHRDSLFGLGQALLMTGDAKAAQPYIAAARDHDALATLVQRASTAEGHRDPRLPFALGAACEKIGRFPEARAWFSLALQKDPLDAEAQKALFRVDQKKAAAEAAKGGSGPA